MSLTGWIRWQTDSVGEIQKQIRLLYSAAAIAAAAAVALPLHRAISYHHQLRAAREQLVTLQQSITRANDQTTFTQREILSTQAEIRKVLGSR